MKLQTDSNRVKQILINLLSNAIKYTQHGYVKVSGEIDNFTNMLDISVEDSGVGIPKESLY